MATIAVLGETEQARRSLALVVEELGHRAAPAQGVEEAVQMLGELRPQALVVAEVAGSRVGQHALAEVDRVQPLLPVIVALERRSAARAFDLLSAGAYEVVAPPWTADNLSPCLAKALRFKGTVFEAAPPPRSRRGPPLAAAALLLAVAAGWGLLARRPPRKAPPPATQAWELPFPHPSGLAYRDHELWIPDWFSQTIYRLDPKTLAVRRAVHYPKETPAALALTPDGLWTVAGSRLIVRHMLDERLSALSRAQDRYGPTVGMAYDGLYLWTVDSRSKKIYKRLLDDALTAVESYPYPGAEPAALAWDGRSLWSVDAGRQELLRHALDYPARVTLRVSLPEYADGRWRPVGLAFDGERFWTAAESRLDTAAPGRVFRHVLAGQGL